MFQYHSYNTSSNPPQTSPSPQNQLRSNSPPQPPNHLPRQRRRNPLPLQILIIRHHKPHNINRLQIPHNMQHDLRRHADQREQRRELGRGGDVADARFGEGGGQAVVVEEGVVGEGEVDEGFGGEEVDDVED